MGAHDVPAASHDEHGGSSKNVRADAPAAKTPSPLDSFNAELDRTGVISESFKKLLRAWAYEIARDAYERGGRDASS